MKTFRALCLAAAMALLVTGAFAQGRGRGHDENKGGGSPPPVKNDGGGQGRGNDNRGNDQKGGGGSPPPVKNDDRGRGNDNKGGGGSPPPVKNDDRGRGNDNRGGGGSPPPVRNDDRGRGNDNKGGGGSPPVRNDGGQGGPGRGRGDDNKGGGGAPPPVRNDGNQGGPGRGNDNRGNDTRGGGSPPIQNNGGQGGPGRGNDTRGNDTRGNDTRGNGGPINGGQGNTRGGDNRNTGGPTRGSGGIRVITDDGRFNEAALDRKNSRSGNSRYDRSHNVRTITKVGSATVIGPAPRDLSNIKRHSIIREENIRLNIGGVRVGYYFYDPRWCDDYFWYPYYTSDPWSYHCVVSPWYYYPMLPAYVRYDRCRFYRLDPWSVWVGVNYAWSRPQYYGNYDIWGRRGGSDVDYAIDDIQNAFQRADQRAAGRLIPRQSEVAIYVDGDYSYTLSANDFYDMFMDATQNTKTIRYTIERVERGRDNFQNTVRVTARHEYEDPWGMRSVVTHYYELRYEGRDLVISKFGVSGG